jgi:hypothetical protein
MPGLVWSMRQRCGPRPSELSKYIGKKVKMKILIKVFHNLERHAQISNLVRAKLIIALYSNCLLHKL